MNPNLPRSALVVSSFLIAACAAPLRGTGDLGVVVERATGSVRLIETTHRSEIGRVAGMGDLSHASVVFSRDARYAYVFGRDGGLTKVDLLRGRIAARTLQSGNAIGGAISQDGAIVAVANYTPGGIRLFDAATLAPLGEVRAGGKVVGIGDAPGNRFVFSVFDTGEIWVVDASAARAPRVTQVVQAGKQPYDGFVTADGRYYIAGLYGEDGLALLDLWHPERGVRRVLEGYGRGEAPLPVFKMPHLRGWAAAGRYFFLPAVGHHEVLVLDRVTWREAGRIAVQGQPVFAVAQPGGRRIWVNFALPDNGTVQVIDVEKRQVVQTLHPGRAVLHMEFTPRGEQVWVSSRDDDRVIVYDTATYAELARLPVEKPSGIFLAARAAMTGF